MAKKKSQFLENPRAVNRRAWHEYHILEKLEVGIQLTGGEVKSLRQGQVSLAEGFVRVEPATMELFLYGVDIAPYMHAGPQQAIERKRRRKLLAHRREISKLLGQPTTSGLTIVPLAMYFLRGWAKLEIGVARGKKAHDKRQVIKSREADRAIRRGLTRRVI